MKILITEDDEVTLQAIEIKLQNDGFETMAFANIEDAINVLDSYNPDLVVTDILMPHTSGLEFIGIIRSDPQRKMPIIVLSSLGQEKTVMEAFQLGADDFITKPFNPARAFCKGKKAFESYKLNSSSNFSS